MSEEITPEQLEPIVAEAKAKGKFVLKDVLEQKSTSYPEKSVTIFRDAAAAAEALWIGDELLELKTEQATLEELQKKEQATGSIVGDPEIEERLEAVAEQVAELEAKQLVCLQKARDSRLTFRMRGVAPKLWRAIDAHARASIKAKDETEEAQQAAFIARNDRVTYQCIAHAILSITDADGNTDDSSVSYETVAALHDILLMSEWEKIKKTSDLLSFGNGYFQRLVEEDADFLPKP